MLSRTWGKNELFCDIAPQIYAEKTDFRFAGETVA
jgi:hypothetical protein